MRPTRRGAVGPAALALLCAGAVAGCGGARPATHAERARAAGDRPPAVRVSARVRAEEASIHRKVSASLRSAGGSRQRYGAVPADLRHHQSAPPDQVLSARAAHPAAPITGIAVQLHLAAGSARAVGVGPYVPLRDQGSFHNHTPATWRITFSDVHGTVPLRASMFTITDEQGQTLRPRVSVLGGGRLPASAPAGRTLTVVLAARILIGSGTMSYLPVAGQRLVGWAFDAETD